SCAHRAIHGGESCSEFGKRIFASEGWQAGFVKLRVRFRACHAASRSVRNARRDTGVHDDYLDEPPGADVQKKPPPGTKPAGSTDVCVEQIAECCCWCAADSCTSAATESCAALS